MEDDDLRKMVKAAMAKADDGTDEVKEISDLMALMPQGTSCDTVINSYYRRRLTDGSLLVVKSSLYVDKDRYTVHKIRINPDGTAQHTRMRCRDDVEALRESVMFLGEYESRKNIDG